MSTDGSTIDPLASLIAAIDGLGTSDDLEGALDGLLASADPLRPAMSAVLVQDPDRPALQVVATRGFDEAARAQLGTDAGRPLDGARVEAGDGALVEDRVSVVPARRRGVVAGGRDVAAPAWFGMPSAGERTNERAR